MGMHRMCHGHRVESSHSGLPAGECSPQHEPSCSSQPYSELPAVCAPRPSFTRRAVWAQFGKHSQQPKYVTLSFGFIPLDQDADFLISWQRIPLRLPVPIIGFSLCCPVPLVVSQWTAVFVKLYFRARCNNPPLVGYYFLGVEAD